MGLTLDLEVIENTPADELDANVRRNAVVYENWLQAKDEHDRSAILIGGGASINDHIDDIRELQLNGAAVFAMNGASQWARENRISVDFQLILDAKQETSALVDPFADAHYYSSQCHADTLENAENLTLWHLNRPTIEDLLPVDRVKAGGYVIVGGDSSVGVCALCLAYTQGYRDLHVFGYDTAHRNGDSHGYDQPMNKTMPTFKMDWAGESYDVSIALKDQCKNLVEYSTALKEAGCNISVYGEGLFQTVYNTDADDLTEQDKYRLMWMFSGYRCVSPGENIADFYVQKFEPTGNVIDFGCGTGRASIKFREAGLTPLLLDFADNCRDDEALDLPFSVCDLTESIPLHEAHGFCADVMEHIPTDDVDLVINNIMAAADKVFFQISTVDDVGGGLINAVLHHTVKPHNWWKDAFKRLGYEIEFSQNLNIASLFYVSK